LGNDAGYAEVPVVLALYVISTTVCILSDYGSRLELTLLARNISRPRKLVTVTVT